MLLRFALIHLAATVLCAVALTVTAAEASPMPVARSVALDDATVHPAAMRLVAPGHSATFVRQCAHGTYFTETSAYVWNGHALPAQQWNADRTITRWGSVTFDGLTFRNNYSHRFVLVAGWCG